MIYNAAHGKLVEVAGRQGWDEETAVIHLTGFVSSLDLTAQFAEYLETVAAEEEAEEE